MAEKIVAMILAGGKGTRLEDLTKKIAKPAVSFGAKYRIIDFPLSNCANSGITTVGVLTQYESVLLDQYVGNGEKWGLNGVHSRTSSLPPRQTEEGLSWYKGTADAIYENLDFLDACNPEYVLILSGDHIYCTTYNEMLDVHINNGADCTIAVYQVPMKEASRFGILNTDKDGKIIEFQEKPAKPKSNLASMGIYIFTYKTLRKELIEDAKDETSEHDFGKNIIPKMLDEKKVMMSYVYKGYWKDVGTISSLHEANMDLLLSDKTISLHSLVSRSHVYSEDTFSTPQFIGKKASVKDSLINQGAVILGKVERSVISNEVLVEEDAYVKDTIIMPGAKVKRGAKVINCMIAPNSVVNEKEIYDGSGKDVILIANRKVKIND